MFHFFKRTKITESDLFVNEVMTTTFWSVDLEDTLQHAAKLMREHQSNSLVVTKEGKPAGIITEADMTKAVADTATTKSVKEYMTSPLISIPCHASLSQALDLLKSKRIRQLPVHDDSGVVCGMLTESNALHNHPKHSEEPKDSMLYYVQSPKEQVIYEEFIKQIQGRTGLIITPLSDSYIREKYGLIKTPILVLREEGPNSCSPKELDKIFGLITDFLQSKHHQTVLLHGVRTLLDSSTVDSLYQVISGLRTLALQTESVVLVAVNPEDPAELRLLRASA